MTALEAMTADGAFNRRDAGYHNRIEVGGQFEQLNLPLNLPSFLPSFL